MMNSEEIEQKLEELKIQDEPVLTDPLYSHNQMLTEQEALAREKLVSDIKYSVLIGMAPVVDRFRGRAEISFTLK